MEYIIFLIMKQKRFKNFGNIGIGYQSVNGQYIDIDISPKKSISLYLYLHVLYICTVNVGQDAQCKPTNLFPP